MRPNFALGLAAVALAFGITGGSAAAVDFGLLGKSAADASSLMPPQGNFASGLSAIKERKGSGPTEGSFVKSPMMGNAASAGLARPNRARAWRDGLSALTPEFGAISEDVKQALMPAPGMQINANGFAAIRAAKSSGKSDPAFESLLSGRAGVERSNFYLPPSK
jgi:hypothetical protein